MNRKKSIKVDIIPTRYGSRRIKKKNLKNFNSKPTISLVLEKFVKFDIFENIIVSSDNKRI